MSIVRWGEHGSSVYIIGADAGWECVGCRDGMTDDGIRDHIAWHRERGDVVPALVEERLRCPT